MWEQATVELPPRARGLHDLTADIRRVVQGGSIRSGLCHVFLQHTSASLVIQENADSDVLRDLSDWFLRAAPDADPRYRHVAEGPDDMSAHIRAALTAASVTVPVVDGDLGLGTWQAVYLFEHRTAPHPRRLVITVNGVL